MCHPEYIIRYIFEQTWVKHEAPIVTVIEVKTWCPLCEEIDIPGRPVIVGGGYG